MLSFFFNFLGHIRNCSNILSPEPPHQGMACFHAILFPKTPPWHWGTGSHQLRAKYFLTWVREEKLFPVTTAILDSTPSIKIGQERHKFQNLRSAGVQLSSAQNNPWIRNSSLKRFIWNLSPCAGSYGNCGVLAFTPGGVRESRGSGDQVRVSCVQRSYPICYLPTKIRTHS